MRVSGWKVKKVLRNLDNMLELARLNYGNDYYLQKMIVDSILELTPIKKIVNRDGSYSKESMFPGRPIFISIVSHLIN